jgi:integrase
MSSRALTGDIIRRLYHYNNSEGRSDIGHPHSTDPTGETQWGNPRRRLLVHSVLTLAFICLLRIDEVLNLQFQDLQYRSSDHVEVTLDSRKTHPFGG